MAMNFLLKRSGTASKRPVAASMALGELDLNYDASTGGLYYKDSAGAVVKVGPCQVSATAPNVAPAGSSGNSAGEFWYDTVNTELKLWNGSAWVSSTPVAAGVSGVTGTSPVSVDNTDPQNPVVSVDAASTSAPGVVQLNDSTTSTSTTQALTANQGYNLQQQIDALTVTSNLTLAGTFNASTGLVDSVTLAGTSAGFVVGSALPSPAVGNEDHFVIVDVTGSTGPSGAPPYHVGDWFLSDGAAWNFLNVGYQPPSATTSQEGVVQLATDAEVQAGVNTDHAVVPSALQSKVSDSVSTTSSTTIASSTAVKSAYDAGVQGQTDAAAAQLDADQALLDAAAAQGDATQALADAAAAQADATQALADAAAAQADADQALLDASAAAAAAGSAVPDSSYAAIGDILAGTGSGTYSALTLGSDGQVLTADSACVSGVKWAAGGGGGGSPATPTVAGIVLGYTDATNVSAALGSNALLSSGPTAGANVAVGADALICLVSGFGNVAVGYGSLFVSDNSQSNVSIGTGSMSQTTTGSHNVGIGTMALSAICTSCNNVSVGDCSMYAAGAGDGNVALGAHTLCMTSGCNNVAVGVFSSCASNSGDRNVTIGPETQVASNSGSCQLAIGFSATDNWLTGTSTKAIKPGAGIIDCAGSCGTAGQVLMSNGSNAVCWGAAGGASPSTPTVAGVMKGCTVEFNTSIGCNAFASLTTGTGNVALGRQAACRMTSGTSNTAVGDSSLFNVIDGRNNTAVGSSAMLGTTGWCNTAVGSDAMLNLKTGCWNTSLGYQALRSSSNPVASNNGFHNVAIGASALSFSDTSCCNVAVGSCALLSTSSGLNNTAVGFIAGCAITSGNFNVVVGSGQQVPNDSGSCQLSVGWGTGCWLTGCSTGAIRPAAGIMDCAGGTGAAGQVLMSNGANAICWGTAGGASPATPTVAGTVLGLTCAPLFVTALGNCAYSGLLASGSSSDNVALGPWTFRNSSGTHLNNVAVGSTAMQCTVGALQNVAIGSAALCQVTGCSNVSIGFSTARSALGANCNVILGATAGRELTTGTNNVLIGFGTGGTTPLGIALIDAQANRIIVGNNNHTCAQVKIAWTVTSDVRDKAIDPAGVPYGLEFINQVDPIAYRWCDRDTNEITDERLRYGFSAQNLLALETETPEGVIISDDNPDCLQLTDQHLLPVLVNAIKELSAKNDELEARLRSLEIPG